MVCTTCAQAELVTSWVQSDGEKLSPGDTGVRHEWSGRGWLQIAFKVVEQQVIRDFGAV